MQFVVDSNYLQDERLREFLTAKTSNYAILTDSVIHEIYKGDTIHSLFRRMEIISEFPKQVRILKGASKLCQLSGRSSGLSRRMICQKSTEYFTEYCHELRKAKSGHIGIGKIQFMRNKQAKRIMSDVLINAERVLDDFREMQAIFNKEEIRIIRTNKYSRIV